MIFMWSAECVCACVFYVYNIFVIIYYVNGDKPSDRKNDNFKTGDRRFKLAHRYDIVCIVRTYGVYIYMNYYKV